MSACFLLVLVCSKLRLRLILSLLSWSLSCSSCFFSPSASCTSCHAIFKSSTAFIEIGTAIAAMAIAPNAPNKLSLFRRLAFLMILSDSSLVSNNAWFAVSNSVSACSLAAVKI